MITGGGASKTYTAYRIVTIFDKSDAAGDIRQHEVDRRFSEFEKLHAYLRN